MSAGPHAPRIDPAVARDLLARARAARANAYAPYSNFPVGAALLAADGRIFTGVNVENASYGLANCAERTAIFKAVSEGVTDFTAIAVTGPRDGEECPPCGACRQVLLEFGAEMVLVTPDADGYHEYTVGELLPRGFSPAKLAAGGGAA